MSTLTLEKKMLYCPKCQRKYDDGSQRFCNNDGGRLLPVLKAGKSGASGNKGVFTSLLGRVPSQNDRDEKLASKPRVVNSPKAKREAFNPTAKSSMFKSDVLLAPQSPPSKTKTPGAPPVQTDGIRPTRASGSVPTDEGAAPKPKQDVKPASEDAAATPVLPKPENIVPVENAKPIGRLVSPNEISSGRAPLGDRAAKPAGRTALSWKDPESMLGQVIKGRYRIVKTLRQYTSSIVFVAEDTILKGKNVVVRILKQNGNANSFEDKIFLEERISLSHVNHPNVAKVIDSGEMPEGNHFIVTSELRTNSVEGLLERTQTLNPLRIARIVRQASYALSEVHQNGILHRNIKPEHLLLTVSEAGIEQVKVTDFCVSDGSVDDENFRFKAPEQIGGQLPTFSSDSYALAVIAYRLLTNRFPFEGSNEREVLAAQKKGLIAKPSELNSQLSEAVDPVFVRALDFESAKRFPKARDFGESLFNVINEHRSEEEVAAAELGQMVSVGAPAESVEAVPVFDGTPGASDMITVRSESNDLESDMHFDSHSEEASDLIEGVEAETEPTTEKIGSNETLWQNRSPEPVSDHGLVWTILPAIGILILFLAAVGIWWQFFSHETNQQVAPTGQSDIKPSEAQTGVDLPANTAEVLAKYDDSPPVAREVAPPEGSVYFENSRLNLSEKLVQKYQGFSLYYPKSWGLQKFDKKNLRVDDKFVDIALNNSDGVLLEQLTIEPYTSAGTFTADTELFPKLVAKSNKDISAAMPGGSFKVVEQGVNSIQNGRWKAYEVSFEVKGKVEGDGEALTLWGRRLWIPVQNKNARTGFIVTMLATSLSKDVRKAEDVGRTGDLESIIQTFEPKP